MQDLHQQSQKELHLKNYISLTRLNKPIGIFLLLWQHSGHYGWPVPENLT